MNPDSTLTSTNNCPKDGVHLYRHYAFKTIYFCDTLIAYNNVAPTNEHE